VFNGQDLVTVPVRISRHVLGRILIVTTALAVVAGLAVDAYLWHEHSGARTVAEQRSPAPLPPAAGTPASPVPAPSPVPVPAMSLVADVVAPTIPVYGSPAVGKVLAEVPNVNAMGQPEPLLVMDASVPGWYEVELPIRPNGSEGWISASGISVRQDPDYIRVYQSQFRLEYYVGGQLVKSFRVAVGAPSTPTPYGRFYVWASEPFGAPYTPGIFALSAFSPVLTHWPGGGRAGIHGWTDTSIIGSRASNGCVRMAPSDFAQLLHVVPLGTPVDILN
jgi:lipoprotein-anchoring transpeptidase ErfK/SrfK